MEEILVAGQEESETAAEETINQPEAELEVQHTVPAPMDVSDQDGELEEDELAEAESMRDIPGQAASTRKAAVNTASKKDSKGRASKKKSEESEGDKKQGSSRANTADPQKPGGNNPLVTSEATEDPVRSSDRYDWSLRDLQHTEERATRQEATSAAGIFLAAFQSKDIMKSTIASVEIIGKEVYWVCYESNVTIRIPSSDSYMVMPAELLGEPTQQILRRRKQLLSEAISAQISYIVTGYATNPDGSVDVTGSRTTALARERARYFGPKAVRKIVPGSDCIAQIISIGDHTCWVNVYGLDIHVKKHDLSHRYIDYVSKEFHVGQNLRMRIVSVVDDGVSRPSLELSARPIELETFRMNVHRATIGARTFGTVTSLRRQPATADHPERVLVSLFLDGMEVPAYSTTLDLSSQDRLQTGDRVGVEIERIMNNGFVRCKIISIICKR